MDASEAPWGSTYTPSSRPASQKSARSSRSQTSSRTTEQTPLLAREDRGDNEGEDRPQTPAIASLLRSLGGSRPSRSGKVPVWKRRWPSILALVMLVLVVIFIMLGFLATEGIEEYAMQAADFRPTKLSLDGLTDHGAKVHVEGDFTMDASKVHKKSVRNIGRFGTWIAKEVESGPTDVDVYLPEYGNILIGKAKVPGIKVNIRNGRTTHVSFITYLEPGSPDGIRNVANDWIEGRLGQIRLKGRAEVLLKSGLINIGKQTVEQAMVFQGNDIPSLPHYNIAKLNLREANHGHTGMAADASIVVRNDFPVGLTLPLVAVDVSIDGCSADKHVMVGTAETGPLVVRPKSDVHVNVTGNVEKLSDSITGVCPHSTKSPLDAFLADYMKGDDATLYINCCRFPDPSTPSWARDLLKDITVPVPFAGRDMGNLIKNFSLADVHFSLPDPWAEPGSPEAAPKISAVVKVEIGLPNEMNFPIDVNQVKADADIYYHHKKLGKLNLEKWQHASSKRIEGHGKEGPTLLVQSNIKKAPIDILDDDLFSEVIQAMLFGGKSVLMDIKAAVSVGVETPMGKIAVRGIPAEGVVPVKPIRGGKDDHDGDDKKSLSSLNLKIGNLSIIDTSPTSITLQAHVNITNPTNYSATVPYFNINILVNGTGVGQAIAKNIEVHPGNNTDLIVSAVWDPFTNGGEKGKEVGRELLSQYISGFNTSLTLQAHNASIPAQPSLGNILSHFPLTIPAPQLSTPRDPEDDDDPDDGDDDESSGPHFIRDATMHLISSTALFTLMSPFSATTLYITKLNATAYYEGHPSAKILYEWPFAVPPGLSESPRLPVDWNFGSVGYGAIRRALGGKLKLTAFAHVGIRIGYWRENIWFQGGKIGANVRL
ncbi:hypothetical protein P153DRAFT_344426 [Dothidotthia symphoricarpi CBS 119687]|uniref:Pre-rrna processing protein n=1 Tax=Dothidotthia symphoricarpi CBS 119687 TaxID=1392245 RepID=A0A6A6A5D9_9PLEO|nr:uncharacterized protein P153DRAFT_344426 [Dothidotthia symphoricarpi CBS 119687]KAF2127109.1 hypothetical protein P153DRAFT_344426 [Dothidotthia symphoricarpi CBS 119687]